MDQDGRKRKAMKMPRLFINERIIMKAIVLVCSALLFSISSVLGYEKTEDEMKIDRMEGEILNMLTTAKKENDHLMIAKAVELCDHHFGLTKANNEWRKKYAKKINPLSYRMRLSLLQAIANMRDWAIDDPGNEKWPPKYIMPEGEIPKKYIGMPSSEIGDPELRQKYETALLENQERRRKLEREFILERSRRSLVLSIQVALSGIEGVDAHKHSQYMLLMSNIVTNVKMREQIHSDRRLDSFKIAQGQNKIQLATNGVAIESKKKMNVKSNVFNSTSNTQIRTSEDEVPGKQEKRANNINGIICCMALVGISCFAIRRLRRK